MSIKESTTADLVALLNYFSMKRQTRNLSTREERLKQDIIEEVELRITQIY